MALKRQQSKKARERPRLPPPDRLAASEWRESVMRRARWRCEACGGRAAHAHHVVYDQELRRRSLWRWDPRNGMAVCLFCHERHHNRSRPIHVDKLREDTLDAAFSVLGDYAFDYIHRRYGGPTTRLESRVAPAP